MLQAAVQPVLLMQGVDDQFSFLFREIKHVEEAFRFWLSSSVSDTSDEDNSSTLRWSLSRHRMMHFNYHFRSVQICSVFHHLPDIYPFL